MAAEKLDIRAGANKVNNNYVNGGNKTYVFPFNPVFADIYIDDCSDKKPEQNIIRVKPAEEIVRTRPADPTQDLFTQMRHLSSEVCKEALSSDRFREMIFYKQALFMADFEDNFHKAVRFDMYYPYYQMMNYEQLRTYFTWRSQVRRGNTVQTDLSYVFLYIYELINNIGVKDGEDGITKLLDIWRAYKSYGGRLDKYMADWVRDYYIINQCPYPFEELLRREPVIRDFYPPDTKKYTFDFYCDLSAYKIKQSVFFTKDNESSIKACFNHVIYRLSRLMANADIRFNDLIFDRNGDNRWHPFSKAIFYMKPEYFPKGDKTVKIPGDCEYRYRNGKWTYTENGNCTAEGRQILSYIFKRMEQLLRGSLKFKYKLNADDKNIDKKLLDRLLPGIGSAGFLKEIDAAVKEYYTNSRKTIVKVDESSLEKIRQNALITQEKLIVAEDSIFEEVSDMEKLQDTEREALSVPELDIPVELPAEPQDVWDRFIDALEPVERGALTKIIGGITPRALSEYAREIGLMSEVLLDNINQKALDLTGDTILELSDDISIYEDYRETLEKLIERHRK